MLLARCDVLVGLPSELTSLVVYAWLDLKDVAVLDSAYCTVLKRGVLLSVLASLTFALPESLKAHSYLEFTRWASCRNIKVDSMNIVSKMDPVHTQYALQFGDIINQVTLQELDFRASTSCSKGACSAIQNSTHLTKILLDDCCIDKSTVIALSQCSSLREIHIKDCTDKADPAISKVNVAESNALHVITLRLRCDPVVALAMLRVCSPVHLKRLEVCVGAQVAKQLLKTFHLCSSLTALSLNHEVDNKLLVALLNKCPHIQHLDLRDACHLSDECAGAMTRTLTQLKTLNIAYTDFTDVLMNELAENCGESLETLYLGSCAEITGEGINSVLKHCRKLRTLHMCTHDDSHFDASLLCNLATLILQCDDEREPAPLLREIAQHCLQLRDLGLMLSGLQPRDLSVLCSSSMPALRAIHVYDSSECIDSVLLSEQAAEATSLQVCWRERDFELDAFLAHHQVL